MSSLSRYIFGDIVNYEISTNNPELDKRNGYVLFVKAQNDGFYGIRGSKMRNISEETKKSLKKLGLLLGEDNSDLHVYTFFDYNSVEKFSYDFINMYRWSLTESLKNEAIKKITESFNDGMYPEEFKINSFLESVDYKAETLNTNKANVSVIGQTNNVVETSTGKARTRTEIIKK